MIQQTHQRRSGIELYSPLFIMFEHFRELIILTQGDEYGTNLYQPYMRDYKERERERDRAKKIVCPSPSWKKKEAKKITYVLWGISRWSVAAWFCYAVVVIWTPLLRGRLIWKMHRGDPLHNFPGSASVDYPERRLCDKNWWDLSPGSNCSGLLFITHEEDVGETLYPYMNIKSNTSSKHNLADISETLHFYVPTKHYFVKGVGAVTSSSVKCV